MLSAGRAITQAKESGVPLPEIDALSELYGGYFKFRARGGQVTMIAGMPGALKSMLATFWAARVNVPGLYFSADMALHTAMTRLAASVTGETTEEISKNIAEGHGDYYSDILDSSLLRFCFDPNPTSATFQGELNAWVEAWDDYPRLIVIDNLLDVVPDSGDNEYAGYKAVLLEAKTLARVTGAAVFILHHMSESGTGRDADPHKPSPRKAIQGKVAQTPENVISVAFDEGTSEFFMSVVKHRGGPSSPTASKYVTLRAFPEKNQFIPWKNAPVPAMVAPLESQSNVVHYERRDLD